MSDELRQREFAERFGAAIETWRFEVNSYWTRNSYFAVFQGGAFVALWTLLQKQYSVTAVGMSLFGVLLTLVWFVNNGRMHEYVEYWWNRAGEIEDEFEVKAERRLILGYEDRRKHKHCLRYSTLVQLAPCLFLCGWLWVFCLSVSACLHIKLTTL